MKNNIKVLSIIATLLFLFGYNIASAQNTFTRTGCSVIHSGCVNTPLRFELSTEFGASQSNQITINSPGASGSTIVTCPTKYTKIQAFITVGSTVYSSHNYYSLPTIIDDTVTIYLGANGEGVGPYIIFIKKTGNNQFKVSMGMQ